MQEHKKLIYSSECQPKKEKLLLSALVALFFSFNLMFFSPFDFYLSNWRTLLIPVKYILFALIPATLMIFAVVFAICFLTKNRCHIIAVSLFFGISLAMYIQGSFLSITMGELDGTSLKPEIPSVIINSIIWLYVIAFAFLIYKFKRAIFKSLLIYVSFVIVLLEITTLLITFVGLVTSEDEIEKQFSELLGDPELYCISTNDEFTFSSHKNYIIILTDEYDSFAFDAAAEAAPDCISGFDGFTYYTNTVGMYYVTSYAVPFILTGEYQKHLTYDNRLLFDAINESYKMDLYTSPSLFSQDIYLDYADNYVQTNILFTDYIQVSLTFGKAALYRCLPVAFKSSFWMYSDDFLYSISGVSSFYNDNIAFYDSLDTTCNIIDKDCFKFIYLVGLHTPLNISSDITRVENESVSANDQAIAVNKILSKYFDLLKENGVYENSEIVLLADHGIKDHDSGKYPLLMIKRAGEAGEGITVSNAPISHVDIYPTLLYLAGYDTEENTVFDIKEDEERERYFATTDEYITGNIK